MTSGYRQELVLRGDRAGVTLVCSPLPGAGAKQEPRLFRDLPELLSTVADGLVMRGGFSVSAGQRSGWITLGEKWHLFVRSRGRRPLRAAAVTLW
jgi:hypothetical protein